MKTCLAIALLATSAAAHEGHHAHDGVQEKARALVAAVEARAPVVPQTLLYEFTQPRRETVDYLPLLGREDQGGLRLGLMSLDQRRATQALLREVLSEEGFLRIQAIRALEDELRATQESTTFARLPDAYTVRLFGAPSSEAPWGLKFEGHHVSVNATLVDGSFRGTPLFLGASPAEVRAGPDGGLRVLALQEDLARALLASLSDEQRGRVVQGEFSGAQAIQPGPLVESGAPTGLPAAEMSEVQRALLLRTIASYARHLRPDFAAEELQRVAAAGFESLRFLWRGGTAPGAPCSYEIQGPTVSIQFDAIEDRPGAGANHVHLLWSDPERDFGVDLLARHYAEEHGER